MEMTRERLMELLSYDPATGRFCWIEGARKRGSRYAMVGHNTGKGYLQAILDRKPYLLHRLAWMYMYGHFPNGNLDHINGDQEDNRIDNLRVASFSQNNQNGRMQSTNRSGFKGVFFHKKNKNWIAQICANKIKKHLGSFSSPEEAHEAYCKASRELHGEFSNTE